MAGTVPSEPMRGVFLAPGVSRNKRLYTKDMIAKTVERMKARIADPDGLPIVMRTSHGAGDRSELIVGRVTDVETDEEGRGRFEARWYDTSPARDIAALVRPKDGSPPALRSVSIHGWLDSPRMVRMDGQLVETGDALDVDFIDFTAKPGVVSALIDPPDQPSESAAAIPGRSPIFETWETPVPETEPEAGGEAVQVVDEAAEAYTAQQKRDALDAGQAMKNPKGDPSYTIKNKADLRRAIRAVGRGGADHDDIRKHVMDRAKALGLSAMIPDNWKADGSLKETAATRFGEIRECYDDMGSRGAGFAIDAYNGPVSLTLRAPSLDPSSLRAVAAAAMTAALDALGALDPDFDADIDVPGAPVEDTDDDLEADGAAGDPDAATADDDEEDYAPGSGCPCGCGCAVPDGMVGGSGCPCACGCQVCAPGAPGSESAATAPAEGAAAAAESVTPVPAPVAETRVDLAPDPAPIPTMEEPAMSETTPAAEAATTPTGPAPAPAPAPVIQLTQEQFAELIGAMRAPVAETAPAPAPVAAPAIPAPVAEPAPAPVAAVEQAPAEETVTKTALGETVADAVTKALAAAIPALRDSIVSQYGLPPRNGIRTSETDRSGPETKSEDLWENRADLLLGNLGK